MHAILENRSTSAKVVGEGQSQLLDSVSPGASQSLTVVSDTSPRPVTPTLVQKPPIPKSSHRTKAGKEVSSDPGKKTNRKRRIALDTGVSSDGGGKRKRKTLDSSSSGDELTGPTTTAGEPSLPTAVSDFLSEFRSPGNCYYSVFHLLVFCLFDYTLTVLEIGVSSSKTVPGVQSVGDEPTTPGKSKVVRRSHTASTSGMVPAAVHNVFDNGNCL